MAKTDETIVRGTALALAARLVGAVSTGALTVFLARELGSSGFGVFSLALSIEGVLFLVSDFGVVQALQRFVAERRNDRGAAAEIVADGIRLKLVGSLLVSLILIAVADPIAASYRAPALAWTLRGVAVSLFGMNFLLMCAGIFTALRRQVMTFTSFLIESSTELVSSVTLVLIAGGAAAAAFGRAIGYLVGGAAALAFTVRLLGPGVASLLAHRPRHSRMIAGDAGVLLIVDGAYTAYSQIDSLLIGAYLTVTSVGLWSAPLRFVVVLAYPGQAVASAVAPRLVASGPHAAEPEAFSRSVRLLLILMAAATAALTVWATPIIRLTLGPSFHASAAVLRELAPYVFLSGLGPLVSTGMNYLGAARSRIPIALGTLLVNVVLDLILIPRIGIAGGAVGTDVAVTVYVLGHARYCQRILDVPLAPMAISLVRSLLAGGAMALALLAVGSETIGEMIGGAVPGGVAFVGVLLATGEVTLRELRELWEAIIRRAGLRTRRSRR
jgi:O-antigen/teichoic acid export membrane protein